MVFPGPDSVTVEKMSEHLNEMRADSLDKPSVKRQKVTDETDQAHKVNLQSCLLERVIFIDSTWNQTTRIITDERLQGVHHHFLVSSMSRVHVFMKTFMFIMPKKCNVKSYSCLFYS